MRTHNTYNPWPEEMNRQITGRIATYHFAPTLLGKQNLMRENVNPDLIWVTGNTVIDALLQVVRKMKTDKIMEAMQKEVLRERGYDVNRLLDGKKMVLITGHRRENFGDGLFVYLRQLKN